MRICHVITKPELGGAQISTLNILSMLPRDRYAVSVITSPHGILSQDFKKLEKTECFFLPFMARPINPLLDILALIHIYLIYRCKRFSLVHTHSSKAGILARWAVLLYNITRCLCNVKSVKCKVVHTVHGWSFNDYQPRPLKKFYILLERITARFTTRIICVSNADLETGIKYKIAPRDKFALIKYGIPLASFKLSSIDKIKKRKEIGINNNNPIIGMISCLKPQKSPADYIKACIKIYEKMPDVNFLLIGDGILRAKCERLLASSPMDGRFILTGWRRDVSDILDILDVAVLTSKWEGMPIALIEALFKGCPVVATNVGGSSELVKDGITGYLTRPGAYWEVSERVLSILNDSQMRARMRKEASLSIDSSFELETMTGEIENLYRRLS